MAYLILKGLKKVWKIDAGEVAVLAAITFVLAALLFGLLGAPQLANVLGVPAGLTFSTVFYISLLYTFTDSFGGVEPTDTTPASLA